MPLLTDSRQQKGKEGEALAAAFLERRGMRITDKNVRCSMGEIDLVGRDGKTIVFIEVKARRTTGRGLPQQAVSAEKQRKLTRLAQWYIKNKRLEGHSVRFDVVAVTWKDEEPVLNWIANAFDARE